ncbi:MAG: zinc-ribbon domain-containing protein, partial [Deltaproteobacteria bacterium]|nr:zinc-ribbon domain-containing protein [Deltaproteobacteria bacterium]
MKFLCDRCKTRYSIGDDRVRGKILKIRCKNCANVITVREGMTDADAADSGPARRSKPTTMSPPIETASPAPAGALGAAFASAMTKPPPALEEEWYVSSDGNQSGPYSLTEAQRWIGSKAFDADLHCWSEGFDDWLPVDKVSHFRGLRKKPAPPAAPPPLPRATGPQPALRAQTRGPAVEEEPKPLFAATMASLEKGAAAAAAAGMGMPAPPPNGTGRPSSTPPTGQSRYPDRASPIGGTPAIPSIQAKTNGSGPSPRIPSLLPTPAGAPAKIANKSGPVPRLDGKPAARPFDVGDQAAQIEPAPFEGEAQTTAEPVASHAKRTASEANDVFARAAEPATPAPRLANAPITPTTDSDDDDDDLSFGEVSRVVNLADLARSAKRPEKKTDSSPALSAA